MTIPAAMDRPVSRTFADDEPVYASMPGQLPGVRGPAFGRIDEWPCDCLRRPANKIPAQWKCVFPIDPVWNLRVREVAFSMLNPNHQALRNAGIFLPRKKWATATVIKVCFSVSQLGAWARREKMPDSLHFWSLEDWQAYVDHCASSTKPESVRSAVGAVRHLVRFSAVLTGTAPLEDPWPGRTDSDVAKVATGDELATPSIAPEVWWPLLRAAWSYIDRYSASILDQRDREAERASAPRLTQATLSAEVINEKLELWLTNPANLVPVSDRENRVNPKGSPIWSSLSRAVTAGASSTVFATKNNRQGTERRQKVTRMIESTGRIRPVRPTAAKQFESDYADYATRRRSSPSMDATLQKWLANPANLIPVHAETSRLAPGEPVWSALESLLYDTSERVDVFGSGSKQGRRRRDLVLQAAVGERRTVYSDRQLDRDLRMLRASCYIFVAALSAMRDSEIQEIQRGALTQHYGAPAIGSQKSKGDLSRPRANWWIIEPVAQALAVAERLTWHDTHIFASMAPPSEDGPAGRARAGISAADDIDFFIETVNTTRHLTGLEEIPPGRVRPHMFRRTMSIIASQQPDGDIALGIQLKHAARRALANRLTGAYGKTDAKWAKEFDTDLQTAAAQKLAGLLKARRSGATIAVGPGAARFHAGLDKVNAAIEANSTLRAQVADERLEITLLRDEFANLHLGTVNHCLWNAPTAECHNQLPPAQRGQAPLLGACQPSRCRNSVLTLSHERIWRMEESDLMEFLKKKLSKPLREQAQTRLDEVRTATAQIDKLKENL
ncbi:hypothetical protein OG819_44515 [Streptomyces sp. NBC_01549]|uniref:hypothetical protein n=1 Tax=Streptomyces sp. NBC_01549 TaxID=2975874 RepID=UPI00224F935B|nr:hypothetical protein [Streptomyces sp. NBC_01549]MCX4596467.1 hypothetical protein [Streptomyces sp. NBC_01549]